MDESVRAAPAKRASPFPSTEQADFYLGMSARRLQQMRALTIGSIFVRHGRYARYHIDDLETWSLGSWAQQCKDPSCTLRETPTLNL